MVRFLELKSIKQTHKKELARISNEVNLLSRESDLEFIKRNIKSDVLSEDFLEKYIETKYNEHQHMLADRKIDSKTIVGTLLGLFLGTIIGSLFFVTVSVLLNHVYYFLLITVYIIVYYTIKLITKQSRNNAVVFIGSFLGTLLVLLITFFLVGILK